MTTSSSAKQFKLDLQDAFETEVEQTVILIQQKIAMEALNRVVMKSPVDTGRFRGNWTVAVGRQDLTVTDNEDKPGNETIARGTPIINGAPTYSVIWLSNNLPYAEALENGHSKQAPAGIVALTYAELSQIVRVA